MAKIKPCKKLGSIDYSSDACWQTIVCMTFARLSALSPLSIADCCSLLFCLGSGS